MTKRLLFFSIYDEEGVVDRYIEYLLSSFRECVQRMVVVVNGALTTEGRNKLLQFSDDLIVRENKGFDAGAYKEAIFYVGRERIREYDELIICNDTCYGPFVPYSSILMTMEERDCDFWGIYYTDKDRISYICSYFLVFRSKILQEDTFFEYFEKKIDENTKEVSDVHVQFETGLYMELKRKYKDDVYIKCNNVDVARSPDYAIEKYKYPLMKRRVFRTKPYHQDNAYNALKMVDKMGYDISMIRENISRLYGMSFDIKQIQREPLRETQEEFLDRMIFTSEDIKIFCGKVDNVYIYGCGIYAKKVYSFYKEFISNFRGFIVSDGHRKKDKQYGYPIFYFREICNEKVGIIMGLDRTNTAEVRCVLPESIPALSLWEE